MRKIALLVLGVMVLSFAGVAMAQTTPAPATQTQGQYPNVASLKAFSAEANYMSLAGYLRYLVFQQTGQWLTREEAVRIVSQQQGM
ncbi:MAG: hypothetical protein ACYDAB_10255 [bacterium]